MPVRSIPDFYNPARIGRVFQPDFSKIAEHARSAGLPAAEEDRIKIQLLIVDMQVDFCHPEGSLYVPGALDDLRRLIEFIYRQAERITRIICSLDSHLPYQIFHPCWWVDRKGKHPAPFTVISEESVNAGIWQPLYERQWSVEYVKRLKKLARKELTIWPYHVLIGSPGHMLDPELFSSVFWHSLARNSQPIWWMKGSIPKTEHYSVVQSEIPVPEHPQGTKNRDFIELIMSADYTLIAGEAASHCVLETIEDLVEEFAGSPEFLKRLIVLEDCTSPVQHPQIDYAAITRQHFADFARQGIRFIKSTDGLPF